MCVFVIFQGCVNTCEDRIIADECQCRRSAFPSYYNKEELKTLPQCETDEREYEPNFPDHISINYLFSFFSTRLGLIILFFSEVMCMWNKHKEVNYGRIPCLCREACK